MGEAHSMERWEKRCEERNGRERINSVRTYEAIMMSASGTLKNSCNNLRNTWS